MLGLLDLRKIKGSWGDLKKKKEKKGREGGQGKKGDSLEEDKKRVPLF